MTIKRGPTLPRDGREWVSPIPYTPLSNAAYARLWREQSGRCPKCGRRLKVGNVQQEHVKARWAGGINEGNVQLWCRVPCSSEKNGEENKQRAKADRALKKHLGLKTKKQLMVRPLPGTKRSGWKHKLNGQWVRR